MSPETAVAGASAAAPEAAAPEAAAPEAAAPEQATTEQATTEQAAPELAEAHLRGLLASLSLAVEYTRGSGDTLYHLDADGTEVPVVDFVGGYGSLILGHNHPDVVEVVRNLLERQVPMHAQFSWHPYANDLAAALNRVLHREFDTREAYRAIFASTGAEAVECALKHSELERGRRLATLQADIDANLAAAEAAVGAGATPPSGPEVARFGDIGNFGELVAAIRHHNARQIDRPPVFLAVEGSFHGKLAGSGQLTHNPGYRTPFQSLAVPARFVPPEEPGAIAKVVEAERLVLLDVSVTDGKLRLVERDAPSIAAFFIEPVQGEGGIRPMSAEFAGEIRRAADAAGFPIVVDEIQSGVGRTGTFFASAQIDLLGDYVLLAKSLGGGVAKSSVMLVRDSRYQTDFELVHSSTFAKDALSCHIGSKVVDLLERDGGQAYRRVRQRGERLAAALRRIAELNSDVVAEVRGTGLMLGLEFRDQSDSRPGPVREFARNGLFGYLIAGYLLREHRIRVFPTASATHTLRFQPSLQISDAAIEQLSTALQAVCQRIRDADPTILPG